MNTRHPNRPPDIPRLLAELQTHAVSYVLAGSVAAQVYGVDLQPGDLDIVPALDRDNVQRLVVLLRAIEAQVDGSAGHWEEQPDGEQRWVEQSLTPEERAARAAAWVPLADDLATLDCLFRTRYGNFDVVPKIAGTYDTLMQRAERHRCGEQIVLVAHIDDLLGVLTVPRRKKDTPRVQALRALQRHR